MADRSIYIVSLNTRVVAAFTQRRDCMRWLGNMWPQVPTNLRVVKVRDGGTAGTADWQAEPKDITATLYGLAD